MRSIRLFQVGDRVVYSFSIKGHGHRSGTGIILRRCGGEAQKPAYEIRTPRGLTKMLFASELRKA